MTVPLKRVHHRLLLTAPLAVVALFLAAGCGDDDAGSGADPEEEVTEASEENGAEENGAEDETTEGSAPDEGIALAEVEENDSPDSCWAVIDGTVYDLTEWIDRHPGGPDRIEQLCGTDATDQFSQQHGGSQGPEGQLDQFEIGSLEG